MIKIVDGAFLFKGALALSQQIQLINLYKDSIDDFYIPKLKSGHHMNIKMSCFGNHWSANDYKYYVTRNDVDKAEVKPMPVYLPKLAEPFSKASFPSLKPEWDICIANYYDLGSKLGVHSDNSETKESLEDGKPVVSFSIGASCIFKFGGLNRSDSYLDIKLDSGDVFVFGGPARLNYHGVSKIIVTENCFNDELDNGRLNFTLRKL